MYMHLICWITLNNLCLTRVLGNLMACVRVQAYALIRRFNLAMLVADVASIMLNKKKLLMFLLECYIVLPLING